MATVTNTRIDHFFEGLLHRQKAIFDAIERDNERRHRFRTKAIEAVQRGAQDWIGVTRRWNERPTDLAGGFRDAAEAVTSSRDRTVALVREWLDEVLGPAGDGTRARDRTVRPRPRGDARTPESDASRPG